MVPHLRCWSNQSGGVAAGDHESRYYFTRLELLIIGAPKGLYFQRRERPTGADLRQPRGSAYWERRLAASPGQGSEATGTPGLRTTKKQRAVSAVQKELINSD